ncbi:MAG: DMT family transporter [Thermodesulfobacteriota bacterium]
MIVLLIALALVTGICVCLQGVTNGALAARTSLFAAVFLNGLVVAVGTFLLWLSDRRPLLASEPTPWFLYLGGLYGIAILGCAAFVFPRLGAGAATAFVVAAQLVSALALDHVGVPHRIPVTGARLAGGVLLLVGAVLVLWPKLRG